ncbi:P-loop containing nucleoside triphosphate hydrolase protein [Dioscorea alata]|uniref:P-loop containing nucleoside triphosphate hydrolase protein n=1 Tax=Dioscorea alata TaxID=55571 RepID=A0ACB7W089_DIOAL|nr:P-loop containing nucleoside triphosphate hydrolase protein [Dioscorea alata]
MFSMPGLNMRQGMQKLLPKQMLAKKILEDRFLPFMTEEAPNFEIDGEQISQKGLSKIEIGPSLIALLAKAGCIAKYGRKSKEDWPYQKAKLLIQESIEKSQSIDIDNLEKLLAEESELLLGDAITCAYLSVLQDCEAHSVNEGAEVKRLGGLHVIGTSLHEFRRIGNQVSHSICCCSILLCIY